MLSFANGCFPIVVPHVTDAIQEWVERVAKIPVDGNNKEPECCIIEVNTGQSLESSHMNIKYVIHGSEKPT